MCPGGLAPQGWGLDCGRAGCRRRPQRAVEGTGAGGPGTQGLAVGRSPTDRRSQRAQPRGSAPMVPHETPQLLGGRAGKWLRTEPQSPLRLLTVLGSPGPGPKGKHYRRPQAGASGQGARGLRGRAAAGEGGATWTPTPSLHPYPVHAPHTSAAAWGGPSVLLGGDSGAAVPPRERRTRRLSALQGVSAFPPLPSGSDQSRGAQRVTPNERSASSHIRHCPLPCRIQSMLSGIGVGSSLTPRPTGTSAGHLSGLCSEASLAWGLGTNGPCWPEPPPPQPPLQ